MGLPPFIQSFFQGFRFENTCIGEETQFYANLFQEYDTLLWDFGDGTFSNEENPSHGFASAGDYEVSLTVTIGSESFTNTKIITIHAIPEVLTSLEYVECEGEIDEGINLVSLNNMLIQNTQQQIISYYFTEIDAINSENPIDVFISANNDTVSTNTLWAKVENGRNSDCYVITSFDLIIYPKPELFMEDEVAICEGNSVQLVADQGFDLYNWSTGETSSEITVNAAGDYTLTVSNIYGDLICSTEKTVTVKESSVAIITAIDINDWTRYNNSISIFVNGSGIYEYSLDGEYYQDSNTFTGLLPIEYSVYVRDKNGCGITSDSVYLLYYPRFFTPNNDNKNDYWMIKSANLEEELEKLYIFDRYGKIITELKPNDIGWDGTLNGVNLPTNDYWFVFERKNGRTYTGHFTLKR